MKTSKSTQKNIQKYMRNILKKHYNDGLVEACCAKFT